MPCPGANTEAVAAKARRENEAGDALHFANRRDAVGCAVDIAGPEVGDRDLLKRGQQFAGSSISRADLLHVGPGVEDPVPFHRRYVFERPFREALMALPPALEGAGGETAPPPSKHGQEFAREFQLLRRWIDARPPADG